MAWHSESIETILKARRHMFGASYRTSAFIIFSQTTNSVSRANLLVAHRTMHGEIMGRPGDL